MGGLLMAFIGVIFILAGLGIFLHWEEMRRYHDEERRTSRYGWMMVPSRFWPISADPAVKTLMTAIHMMIGSTLVIAGIAVALS
jgi:hypothetical protein